MPFQELYFTTSGEPPQCGIGFHLRVGRSSVYSTVAARTSEKTGNEKTDSAGGRDRLAESATAAKAVSQPMAKTNATTDRNIHAAVRMSAPEQALAANASMSDSKMKDTDMPVRMAK